MSWTDAKRWQELTTGGTCCPFCAAQNQDNEQSLFVREFPGGILRLNRQRLGAAWYTLIANRHVTEIFQFSDRERADFFASVACAAKRITELHTAVKINYAILGNVIPHVHCHIVARVASEKPDPVRFDVPGEPLADAEHWARSF